MEENKPEQEHSFLIETGEDGNKYIPARSRIQVFIETYPDYTLETHVLTDALGALAESRITDHEGRFKVNGWAYRSRDESGSFVAIAETESKQRACAFLGLGLTFGIASAETMRDVDLSDNSIINEIKKRIGKNGEGE